jgi:hypothetical protein
MRKKRRSTVHLATPTPPCARSLGNQLSIQKQKPAVRNSILLLCSVQNKYPCFCEAISEVEISGCPEVDCICAVPWRDLQWAELWYCCIHQVMMVVAVL